MAITKQYLKSKPECKITFSVPNKEAKKISVAGDFNNWKSADLKKYKNGTFKVQFNVPVNHQYQFKYIVDGQWVNEIEADGYMWNDYAGSENSILKV